MKNISPNPGPVNNRRLIYWNEQKHEYTMKEGIVQACPTYRGDYRRISEEAWQIFKTNYPGSGPTISFEFELVEAENKSKTLVAGNWDILDPPPAPKPKPKSRLDSISVDSMTGFIKTLSTPKASVDRPITPVATAKQPGPDTISLLAAKAEDSERLCKLTPLYLSLNI
jgi:hypothetical protein